MERIRLVALRYNRSPPTHKFIIEKMKKTEHFQYHNCHCGRNHKTGPPRADEIWLPSKHTHTQIAFHKILSILLCTTGIVRVALSQPLWWFYTFMLLCIERKQWYWLGLCLASSNITICCYFIFFHLFALTSSLWAKIARNRRLCNTVSIFTPIRSPLLLPLLFLCFILFLFQTCLIVFCRLKRCISIEIWVIMKQEKTMHSAAPIHPHW